MNIGFYISGSSGRLYKFLKQANKKVIDKIKIVISDYEIGDKLESILNGNGVQYTIHDYKALDGTGNKEKNLALSDLILEDLDKYGIDFCFSFGSHILRGELLKKYNNRLINFHPAILPMYPGVRAIDQAVEHGNTFLVGNTAHFIDDGVDTGTIIMQSVIPLQAFLVERDYNVVLDLQINMLNNLIVILEENRLKIINGRTIISGADYFKSYTFPYI